MASKPAEPDLSVAGRIYQKGKLVPGVLHIDRARGVVSKVAKSTTLAEHIDFGDAMILPGALDIHVHFREPGHTHREDFRSGTTAAAFGGVTGVADMPNTLPPTTTSRAVKEKLELIGKKAVVDYGLWAGGTWFTGDLAEMLKRCVGVKTYLGASTGDLLLEDTERFKAVLEAAGKAGKVAMLHCEAQRVLQQLRRNETSLDDHDMARPPLAEVEAIYDALKALAAVKKPPRVHVAHVASAEAAQAAASAKFSLGATPHHLLLDTKCGLPHAYGKTNPPIRSAGQRDALWKLFAGGRIPILESDHAPHTATEKEDAFHNAPSGVPGTETMMPLMLAQTLAGKVDLQVVVDAATKHPAELLGLADRGQLEVGLRADFAVYPDKVHKLKAESLHAACGWTPFEGRNVLMPTDTFLAGRPVVREGQLVGAPGSGRPLLG
ncbi:MAG: dihydroorotase [Thermoplasmatota archaeon]